MTEEPPAHLTDWKHEDWTPDGGVRLQPPQQPVLHADRARATSSPRSTTTRRACRSARSSSAAAARRPSRSSRSRATGSTASSWARRSRSETTAAATGAVGVVRRDPMAMLPFIGYNAGDYFQHWLDIGKGARRRQAAADLLRQLVPPGRRRADFLWPGFGENSRVLKWVIERLEGKAAAVETPIGLVPTEGALDIDGLDMTPEQVAKALAVDAEEWKAELPLIEEWFAKIGDKLPADAVDRARRPQGPPRRRLTRAGTLSGC